MRISTGQFQMNSLNSMLEQQAKLNRVQQQLSTGRRILAPSDDPAGAARALDLTKSIESMEQFQRNADRAAMRLSMEDAVLDQAGEFLMRLQTLAMQASNDTNGAAERGYIGNEVRELHTALMQLGNATDGAGEYLFAGHKVRTVPFVKDIDGNVVYQGDDGIRNVQIAPARELSISHSGRTVFENVPDGNGGTQSIFQTVETMLAVLQPEGDPLPDAQAALVQAMTGLESGIESLMQARARVGGRLNAIESEMEAASLGVIELKASLSAIEDLDYAEGVTRLTLQLAGLEAAQKSYMKIQGLSLFNYL